MMGNDDSKVDYTAPLSRIILGTATASDIERVRMAFAHLYAWALLQGLREHAEMGDGFALTVYQLAESVLKSSAPERI